MEGRGKGGERGEGRQGRTNVGVRELEGRKLGGGRNGGRGCRDEEGREGRRVKKGGVRVGGRDGGTRLALTKKN